MNKNASRTVPILLRLILPGAGAGNCKLRNERSAKSKQMINFCQIACRLDCRY